MSGIVAATLVLGGYVGGCSQAWTRSERAVLVVECETPQAWVEVDGEPRGELARLGGRVTVLPGMRLIEVGAPGYLSYRTELQVVAGATYALELELWPQIEELDQ